MFRSLITASILLSLLTVASVASADIIVDFTSTGGNGDNELTATSFTFSSQDPNNTGVSFDVVATAVIPATGGANNGNVTSINGGLGSTVENTGTFINIIDKHHRRCPRGARIYDHECEWTGCRGEFRGGKFAVPKRRQCKC